MADTVSDSPAARIFYNENMARNLRKIKKPVRNLVMDVKALPDFLALTVYEENIMEYNDEQRAAVMHYLILCRELIMSYGVRCELNGEAVMPKGRGV